MKLSTRISLVAVLLASGVSAQAACVYPQAPQNLPNGATSTKDQMLAAQATIKEYSKSVQETYLPCLEQEKTDDDRRARPGRPRVRAEEDRDRGGAGEEAQRRARRADRARDALERRDQGVHRRAEEVITPWGHCRRPPRPRHWSASGSSRCRSSRARWRRSPGPCWRSPCVPSVTSRHSTASRWTGSRSRQRSWREGRRRFRHRRHPGGRPAAAATARPRTPASK